MALEHLKHQLIPVFKKGNLTVYYERTLEHKLRLDTSNQKR